MPMLKDTLTPLYFSLLESMLSVEDQLIAHLPRMREAATSESLKNSIGEHLEETRNQRNRLLEIFSEHNYTLGGGREEAFAKMLQQSESTIETIVDDAVRDAYIIAAAQAVEHFEMAKYITLIGWAIVLEDELAEYKLKETLAEEEHADKKLRKLAEGSFLHSSINKAAVHA